jgi:hypothetical protein
MTLSEIYTAALLTSDERSLMPDYISEKEEFYDSPAFEKLYEYFVAVVCEMPYGTAKARTGDPCEWILDKLELLSETEF